MTLAPGQRGQSPPGKLQGEFSFLRKKKKKDKMFMQYLCSLGIGQLLLLMDFQSLTREQTLNSGALYTHPNLGPRGKNRRMGRGELLHLSAVVVEVCRSCCHLLVCTYHPRTKPVRVSLSDSNHSTLPTTKEQHCRGTLLLQQQLPSQCKPRVLLLDFVSVPRDT